jgi:hypothetical protein
LARIARGEWEPPDEDWDVFRWHAELDIICAVERRATEAKRAAEQAAAAE